MNKLEDEEFKELYQMSDWNVGNMVCSHCTKGAVAMYARETYNGGYGPATPACPYHLIKIVEGHVVAVQGQELRVFSFALLDGA